MRKTIIRILASATALGFASQLSAEIVKNAAGEDFDTDKPVTEITITSEKQLFFYDIKKFTVKAGTKVKITLVVPGDAIPQPHNLVIIKPGKEAALVQQAMTLMADPNGLAKGYIPDDKVNIVAHTKMIQPGATDVLEVEIPAEAGAYPYICTFPGHFALMKGVMTVVE